MDQKEYHAKNIKNFAGYPLIAYSIQAALNSKYVTRTIVSTDDIEIANIARRYGAEVPFIRPTEYAHDLTLDFPVFENLLNTLFETENYKPDLVIQLRPTSPIRPINLIDDAIEIMLNNLEIDSVRGVVPSGQNPYKMWKIDPQTGLMSGLLSVEGLAEPYNSARQALPDTYWQTGHIDVIRLQVIIEQKSMSGKKIKPMFKSIPISLWILTNHLIGNEQNGWHGMGVWRWLYLEIKEDPFQKKLNWSYLILMV